MEEVVKCPICERGSYYDPASLKFNCPNCGFINLKKNNYLHEKILSQLKEKYDLELKKKRGLEYNQKIDLEQVYNTAQESNESYIKQSVHSSSTRVLSKCPNCGSVADSQDGKKILFCAYCGARLTESENVVRDVLRHDHEIELSMLEHQQRLEEMKTRKRLESEAVPIDVKGELKNVGRKAGVGIADGVSTALVTLLRSALTIAASLGGFALGIYLLITILKAIISK